MAAPLKKCREATEAGADGVVPEQNPATSSFGTTPPARPFWNLMASQAPLLTQEGNFKTRPANSFTPSMTAATAAVTVSGAVREERVTGDD